MDLKERGLFLREIRKKLGKRMEDLEDENISRGTIGNIETGKPHVREPKVKYYCEKLGVNYDALPHLIEERRQRLGEYKQKVLADLRKIELMIDVTQDNTGLKMLRKINVPKELSNVVDYLKGKSYIYLNDPDKAEKHFKQVVKATSRNVENVVACAYNELSKIAYYRNDFVTAVKYIDQGLAAYDKKDWRQYIYYNLQSNKILYLDKLDRTNEAEDLCKRLWQEREKINHISVLLNLYDLKGQIYRKKRKYDEAIQLITEGLQIARYNREKRRIVELLITLGSIYMTKKDYDQAADCLDMALQVTQLLDDQYLHTTITVKLGELQMQQGKLDQAKQTLYAVIKNKGRGITKYVKALTVYGDCNMLQNQTDDALNYYLTALDLAQKHLLQQQELEILEKIAKVYLETKKEKEYKDTLDKFFRLYVQLNGNKYI